MKKFSVLLSNYNQEQYIYEAIDSILNQSYSNIELIITDDCSKIFEKEKLEKYINSKRKDIELKFVINKENIGTVRTMNKGLKEVSGEYVLIFAADDCLHDNNVIDNFVNQFSKFKNYKVITSMCLLYDNEMKNIIDTFPKKERINRFNKMNAKMQNKTLKFGPFFAPGATAYRSDLFKEINYLDECYSLIEDWSLFLRLSRLGIKVLVSDFIAINHRGGGVSESNKMKREICDKILKDTDLIYKKEVFNDLRNLSTEEKLQVLYRYQIFKNYYGYRYMPIYLNYYYQIFKNKDVISYKLCLRKDKILKYILPLISVVFSYIIYLILKKKIVLIIVPVAIYLLFRKIINRLYMRRISK